MFRKVLILLIYIVGFWILLPFFLLYFSHLLDEYLNFTRINSTLLFVGGSILVLIALPLLVISIYQFKLFSGEFPLSATPPEKMIRKGLFSVWSHPIYLFYTLLFLGIAMLTGSKGMLLITMPVFIGGVCVYAYIEERILRKRFGNSYRNYLKETSSVFPDFYFLLKIPTFLFFKSVFSFEARNKENIPDSPPFFVVASHRNYLDPLLISLSLPYKIKYVTTYEMYRKSFSALLFRTLGCIPKRRYLNDIHTAKGIIRSLDADRVVGIFPEGERSWTGKMNSFKPETLRLFSKHRQIPILPVKLEGNFYAWPRWGKRYRRSKVVVTFQAPVTIDPQMDHPQIENLLSELIRPGDDSNQGFSCSSENTAADLSMIIYRCPICGTFDSLKAKGGRKLHCEHCREVFELDQNYHVHFIENGARKSLSLDSLYERIRIKVNELNKLAQNRIPLNIQIAENNELVTYFENCLFSKEVENKIQPLFPGTLVLTRKEMGFYSTDTSVLILYKHISAVVIESNFKLQVFDKNKQQLYQLVFQKTSAKKCQDYILETMNKFGYASATSR